MSLSDPFKESPGAPPADTGDVARRVSSRSRARMPVEGLEAWDGTPAGLDVDFRWRGDMYRFNSVRVPGIRPAEVF